MEKRMPCRVTRLGAGVERAGSSIFSMNYTNRPILTLVRQLLPALGVNRNRDLAEGEGESCAPDCMYSGWTMSRVRHADLTHSAAGPRCGVDLKPSEHGRVSMP